MLPRAILFLLIIAGAAPMPACAPAPHPGDRVYVVEESAMIVWEPATKTQHFIRRATFQGKADDFGFLVPTPTAPALSAVDDEIFEKLDRMTERKTENVTRKETDWTPILLVPFMMRFKGETAGVTARAPVEVLSTQKVAGYDATVLDATDATALREWLEKNGYATTPDLEEWLDAYIKQSWKITAFKIDKEQPDANARTSAVKMSFTTDRPFFPYREPASQRDVSMSRALRIWFVGPERVSGTIGNDGDWPGMLMWSGPYEDQRLTYYVDTSSIRPGTDDLFFARDADQSTHIPPPYIHETVKKTWIPADAIALPIVILGFVFWRRRRRA